MFESVSDCQTSGYRQICARTTRSLKHVSINNPRRVLLKGKDGWTISEERQFIENLLCQRFNFFLAFFGFVVAGFLAAKNQFQLRLVLTLGAFVAVIMAMAIIRANSKLDILLQRIFRTDRKHPASYAQKTSKKPHWLCRTYSVRKLIGIVVPVLCSALLVAGAAVAWSGRLEATTDGPKWGKAAVLEERGQEIENVDANGTVSHHAVSDE